MVQSVLALVSCLIPRKGKGVTNKTIQVKQFGVPEIDDNGITRDITFPFLDSVSLRDIIDSVELVEKNQRIIKEAFLRGMNLIYRSKTAQAEIEIAMAVSWILEQDLAENTEKAADLAKVWQQIQASMKAGMMPVPTFEDLAVPRKTYVDGQKAAGKWNPTLVPKVETPEETKEEVSEEVSA